MSAETSAATAPVAASAAPALASLSLSMLLASLGTGIANVALPTLTQALDASFQEVQWIVLAYLVANTTLIVGAGRLGDIVGRRRLLLGGLFVFTAASAACALAPTLEALIAARAVQGAGAAAMMALTMAFVGDTVPKERTGRAMGLLGTMSAVGTALGPSLGGVLIAAFGWRAIFIVCVPLGLAAGLLAWRFLPADRAAATRGGFDVTGTALLALTLGAYALAMTTGRGTFGAANAALLTAAALGLGVFLLMQARAPSPLVRLDTLRRPALATGFVTTALVATVAMTTLVAGPFYLSQALELDIAQIGLVMSVGPAVSALTGIPAGRIVDRFGAGRMSVAGLAAAAGGCLGLAAMPASAGVAGYVAPLAVLTAGYALFQAANNTAVMRDIGAGERGAISGVLNLSRNLGLITGASAMGAVFALASSRAGTAAVAEAAASGMAATFAVATMLIATALAIALRGGALARD